jgi:hypothetical protein
MNSFCFYTLRVSLLIVKAMNFSFLWSSLDPDLKFKSLIRIEISGWIRICVKKECGFETLPRRARARFSDQNYEPCLSIYNRNVCTLRVEGPTLAKDCCSRCCRQTPCWPARESVRWPGRGHIYIYTASHEILQTLLRSENLQIRTMTARYSRNTLYRRYGTYPRCAFQNLRRSRLTGSKNSPEGRGNTPFRWK